MFSRRLLTCRVSPSDRSQPVDTAWPPGSGSCCSCGQHRVLVKRSAGQPKDKENAFASTSSFSGPALSDYPLRLLLCESLVYDSLDLNCVSRQHRCSSSSACAVLSSPCKRYTSCPFLCDGSLDSQERSSRAWLSVDSSLGLLESCKKEFPECSCIRDVVSSGCSFSCSDSAYLSASLSSLSLRSLTSPCESNREVFEPCVPTRAALSSTTTTVTATRFARGKGKCSLVSLSREDIVVKSDSRSYTGVNRCLGRSQYSSRRAAFSLCVSVSQKVPCPHSGELNQDRLDFDFRVPVSPVSLHCMSLSSPRVDSNSDAQIDSMSSSDLDHCEDLQSFELAHQLPDVQPFFVCDGLQQTGAPKESLPTSSVDLSLKGLDRHMMSYQEFEQLPPLAEDCGELPALWEDGGALRVESRKGGFSFGGSVGEDEGQWSVDSSVHMFADHADDSSDVLNADDNPCESLEQKSTLIEQTLSEIYESPFQQLMYAKSQPSPKHDWRSQRKISFKIPDSSGDSNLNPAVSRSDSVDGNENIVGDTEDNEKDDVETLSDYEVGNKKETEPVRSDCDTHVRMKASIARAAQRAVHGYRTCDDADSYVGAQVKPTLILARAPPSPSGILRRTNKKAAVKVTHGSVHWADGRPSSLPPTDEAAQETVT